MTLRKQGVHSKLISQIASVTIILLFVAGSVGWGLTTQGKADDALARVEKLETAAKEDRELLHAMFRMTCQLLFHQLGPQTKRTPEECEKYRPLTRE